MELTERQHKLMEVIKDLDTTKRHVLKIACRGNEPWQIEELSTISKIDL